MPSAQLPPSGADAVTRFRPSGGTLSGYVGMAMVVLLAAYLLLARPGAGSVQAALGLVILALLFWLALVRPRAEADRTTLVIRNMLRDVHIPLAAIDLVGVRQTLNVWVGDQRYTCIGIGHSLRDVRRMDRSRGEDLQGKGYPGLVAARIQSLAQAARHDVGAEPGPVRHEWAKPEAPLLAVLVVAFVLALLLG